jgi:hypothetical protein
VDFAPQNGFETYLAGAFTKKSVPAQIVMPPEAATAFIQFLFPQH